MPFWSHQRISRQRQKPPVGADDEPHGGPGLAQPADQQLEDGAAVPGRVAVGGAHVGDQQVVAAEDVQR